MSNLWEFLLQTISVSLVAAVLLVIKRIFEDKLSPRWQYGIWSLLALRMLLPVGVRRYIILPLPLWIETLKSRIEKTLTSAYSQAYEPVGIRHVMPWIEGKPISVTDGLFLVYVTGVVITLVWYGWNYLRLRQLLQKGTPGDPKLRKQIQRVASRYGLSDCPVVTLHGLSSAFVCGVFRPILAVPADSPLDDKVILHELLHLRHGDSFQSILWCMLQALHWCNPFLQYVIYRIRCDMESLCDQRVLERLEGEERREYGVILLNMANETYASLPGTTSVSNGGKNIARRIAAIVRFKKYPRGMAVVSVCIGIMLVSPLIVGADPVYASELFSPGPLRKLDQAMAMSRLERCSTVAGALDTYAKGLMLENGIYIAVASSLSQQEVLEGQMRSHAVGESWAAYHLESGSEFDHLDQEDGYSVWNLTEQEDGSFSALLAFSVEYFSGTESEERYWSEMKQSHDPENVTLVIPVTVRREDAWVVEETGERICSPKLYRNCGNGDSYGPDFSPIPLWQKMSGAGQLGTMEVYWKMAYEVDNTITQQSFFWATTSFDMTLKGDAEFEKVHIWTFNEYALLEEHRDQWPKNSYEMIRYSQAGKNTWKRETSVRSGSMSEDWDGVIELDGGETRYDVKRGPYEMPLAYKWEVFLDGKLVEEIILEEDAYERP